jgi:hypothetical protein
VFAVCGFVGWALNMDRLLRSGLHTLLLHTKIGELWLRDPYRFRYLLIPAFAALGAYGFQAWLDAWSGDGQAIRWRTAAWLAGGSVVIFVLAPLVAGANLRSYVPFLIAVVPTAWLLWRVAQGTTWAAAALPALLAVELTVTALAGQTGLPLNGAAEVSQNSGNSSGAGPAFGDYHAPWIPPSSYTTAGAIGRILIRARDDGGRYLTFDPRIARVSKGFLFNQAPRFWPGYASGRSVLFGLSEVQGYSPVQLMRYWTFLRALDRRAPIYYNSATFQSDAANVLDLFGIEWVIQPSTATTPRASVVPGWKVVSPSDALHAVLDPTFPQRDTVLLEQAPTADGHEVPTNVVESGLQPPASGTVSYRNLSDEHAQLHVSTPTGGVVLVRNPWDENWHAAVDGKSVPLLHADYVMQAVAVPPGSHTIDLTYRDSAIGTGLVLSAIAWLLLLIAFVVLRRRESRGEVSRAEGSSPQRSEPPRDTEPARA